jgi:hypothetical protein
MMPETLVCEDGSSAGVLLFSWSAIVGAIATVFRVKMRRTRFMAYRWVVHSTVPFRMDVRNGLPFKNSFPLLCLHFVLYAWRMEQ